MENNNISTVFLVGFQNLHSYKYSLFCLLVLTFCVSICGNALILTLVSYSKNLKSPMYFFLTQLSICDIMLSIDSVPVTLHVVVEEGGTISLVGCILQYTFFVFSEASECLILTMMSYDRYLAICNPLHYTSIMGDKLRWKLSIISWTSSFIYFLIFYSSISSLNFCGPNIIDHFFCDLAPILELSCSDVSFIQIEAKVLIFPAAVIPFLIIMISYVYIVNAVLNISSFLGRQKAFFTCTSHLTVVCFYYGTLMAVYVFPASLRSLLFNKIFTMIYAVVTPSLNPLIYTLRNKEILEALTSLTNQLTCSSWGHI
ncbi:olfactory receptor 11L1-like [Rana temporaria]|uniref:olfactory receptor 11L1-like n=1 Tax=Rana temporaria TaxID=8407 RepID=UPI001AAC7310|nr:olfactory receptor 11L1-like [Rana temporaria]